MLSVFLAEKSLVCMLVIKFEFMICYLIVIRSTILIIGAKSMFAPKLGTLVRTHKTYCNIKGYLDTSCKKSFKLTPD